MAVGGRAWQLSAAEMACLRQLARHPDAETSHFPGSLLDGLMARGMLDRVPVLTLPVLPQHHRYRLTDRGYQALAGAARGS